MRPDATYSHVGPKPPGAGKPKPKRAKGKRSGARRPAAHRSRAHHTRPKGRPGVTALRVAAAKRGAPYVHGAEGPHRFDCSGLTQYAFRHAGKKLPRTAAAQYIRTRRVPASQRRPGDLVFFVSGRGAYHVGIYAGKGRLWHSPKSGAVVRRDKIWSRSVRYGRVG
ncbi:C40 family peptidase [Streptomyces sp. KR80]|uniref:C40 family peptidase n=1 Tax=Streptomyces sp. KR80 TaxID=3457426 RepID=UPI003FD5E8D5